MYRVQTARLSAFWALHSDEIRLTTLLYKAISSQAAKPQLPSTLRSDDEIDVRAMVATAGAWRRLSMMVVGREGTNAGGRSFAATEADGNRAVERTRAANEKADVAFRSAAVITSQNVMRRSMISERTAARSCRGRQGRCLAREPQI